MAAVATSACTASACCRSTYSRTGALRLRSANRRFLELFGLPVDGFRGRALAEITRGGEGMQDLTALSAVPDGTAPSDVTVTLRTARLPAGVAFRARTFPVHDGTSGHVVLLTVASDPQTLRDTE